jgi:hypothetical protein
MNVSLSDRDIREMLGEDVKVVLYPDIYKYTTLDELLAPFNKVVILYTTQDHYGHWVSLHRWKNTVYFFDSYGLQIDDQLEFVPDVYLQENYQPIRYLRLLLGNSKYNIDYNDRQLQLRGEGVTTCGRWCVARLSLPQLTADQFAQLFRATKKFMPDDLVVRFTERLRER